MKSCINLLQLVLAVSMFSTGTAAMADTAEWPTRITPRPETTSSVPHVQIGVETMPGFRDELLRRVSGIPHVEVRNTVISLPGARGFWLADDLPLARPEVIVGGREFAHIHPDGSLHAALKPETALAAIKAGWAVPHPWAKRRPGWEGFVMIYSPMSSSDVDTIYELVVASYSYVTGRAPN